MRELRVLVVDDSAANRRTISAMLAESPAVQIVGTARDGDEALRMAVAFTPDLITLDLEMPKMDGFTFMRLLMASRPTPVVVISSQSAKDQVFRALELGAIDFIAKPDPTGEVSSGAPGDSLKRQLERALEMVRQLSPAGAQKRVVERPPVTQPVPPRAPRPEPQVAVPQRVIAIASSTGGPTALMELFAALPQLARSAVCVAQHMPERFTRTFAERLDKQGAFRVREAEHTVELTAQTALVCPGGRSLELERRADRFYARVVRPAQTDRYAPSANRLLTSVARAAGDRAIGVVLTGMGDDAALGVQEIRKAGGLVLAESEATAVVYGMPKVAIATGCVDEVLPLSELVQRIKELVA